MSENQNELKHYGILGMKWGVRRYENEDGTLTEAGKKHYANTGEHGYHYHSQRTKSYSKGESRSRIKAESMKNSAAIAKESGNDKKAEKYTKKFEKANKKADKFKKYKEASAEIDALEEEHARNANTSAVLARRLLDPTGFISKAYQQNKAVVSSKKGIKLNSSQAKKAALGRSVIQEMLFGAPAMANVGTILETHRKVKNKR